MKNVVDQQHSEKSLNSDNITPEMIQAVKERAARIAHIYNAGAAWGVSDAGFIIHRLLDVVEHLEKTLASSKG